MNAVYDVEVWLTGARECKARIAGVEIEVSVDYSPPAPECGDGASYDARYSSSAKLVDRADWAKAFPGVEPTCEEMDRLIDRHEAEVLERAAAEAADADASYEVDGDIDEYYFDEGDY
jgi:hypothetical protein